MASRMSFDAARRVAPSSSLMRRAAPSNKGAKQRHASSPCAVVISRAPSHAAVRCFAEWCASWPRCSSSVRPRRDTLAPARSFATDCSVMDSCRVWNDASVSPARRLTLRPTLAFGRAKSPLPRLRFLLRKSLGFFGIVYSA